jgi:very-short-patch-repair endonuclease
LAIARPGCAPCSASDRAVIDAAQWARSDREARLVIAASFQQRLVTLPAVERALREQPKARRRALIEAIAQDCAGGSHSVAELDFLALCRAHRLPLPTRQVIRRDGRGRKRYVDVFFDEWMVAVEIDGSHHLDVRQMWDDAVKANALELAGYTVLRYPAYVIRTEGARIAEEIRKALRRRGWPASGSCSAICEGLPPT